MKMIRYFHYLHTIQRDFTEKSNFYSEFEVFQRHQSGTSKMKLSWKFFNHIANISVKYDFVSLDLNNISFLIFVSSMFSELCISKKHVSQQQLA